MSTKNFTMNIWVLRDSSIVLGFYSTLLICVDVCGFDKTNFMCLYDDICIHIAIYAAVIWSWSWKDAILWLICYFVMLLDY